MAEHIKSENHKLISANLWWEQKPFDKADMFFKLAFMPDDKVKHIASLILD
jgi:hypothetical protein